MTEQGAFAAMRAAVVAEAKRGQGGRSWHRDAVGLGVTYLVVVLASLYLAASVWGHPPAPRGLATGLFAISIAAGLVASVAVARGSRWWAFLSLGAAGLGVVVHVGRYEMRTVAPWFADADCALAELAIAAVPAALTVAVLRGFAFEPKRAMVGGVGAAIAGLLVLDLTCPAHGVVHALGFHLMPALIVAGGAWYARSVMSSRSQVP